VLTKWPIKLFHFLNNQYQALCCLSLLVFQLLELPVILFSRTGMLVYYLISAPNAVIICHLQNNRKRKQPTSSGPANSTGTGNTVCPSANSPPSTPSTHTPGDGLGLAGNVRHALKNLMMYGADGTGLASSSNQLVTTFTLYLKYILRCLLLLSYIIQVNNKKCFMSQDDLEHFGDVGSLDDNVESFLSNDDGDARDIFAALKRSPTEPNPTASKGDISDDLGCFYKASSDMPFCFLGFNFSEVNCWRTSNSKVVCCHFSSDGKILASAGHEKKVVNVMQLCVLFYSN
jgi:hypothetical protein